MNQRLLAPILAVLLVLLVGGCSFRRGPAVDDALVLPLSTGFDVVAGSNTSCGGIPDDRGDWRDLVVRPAGDAEEALPALRTHLESRGFQLIETDGVGPGVWSRYRGANSTIGIEIGTAADYRRDSSQVGPNPVLVRGATGPNDLVLRLYPLEADCMT